MDCEPREERSKNGPNDHRRGSPRQDAPERGEQRDFPVRQEPRFDLARLRRDGQEVVPDACAKRERTEHQTDHHHPRCRTGADSSTPDRRQAQHWKPVGFPGQKSDAHACQNVAARRPAETGRGDCKGQHGATLATHDDMRECGTAEHRGDDEVRVTRLTDAKQEKNGRQSREELNHTDQRVRGLGGNGREQRKRVEHEWRIAEQHRALADLALPIQGCPIASKK